MKVGELLSSAVLKLKNASIGNGPRDSRVILRHVLEDEVGILDTKMSISDFDVQRFNSMIEQRSKNRPVSQIIGKREFWGRDFKVTSETLDPRPDSELIIESSLLLNPPHSILDLGTGTGCLLLTLLSEFPDAVGLGIDASNAALDVAKENAKNLDLQHRATFEQSDWFDDVRGRFDLIVCNPPYISEEEMTSLQADVANWEPHLALTPGGDGLSVYRLLSSQLNTFLSDDGHAIFEVGETQAERVKGIFESAGIGDPKVVQDINGKERAVILHKSI